MQMAALALLLLVAIIISGPVMGFLGLAIKIIFWMVIGNIAGRIVRGSSYGLVGNTLLGLLGGIFGTFVLSLLGMGGFAHSLIGAFVAGVFGAVLFVYLMRWVADKNFGK